MSRKGVKVNYILGNHDHYLRELIKEGNISLGDIEISDELYYYTTKGEKIYICHGDQFDGFVRLHPFLYMLGDWAYELSFKIKEFNCGFPPFAVKLDIPKFGSKSTVP